MSLQDKLILISFIKFNESTISNENIGIALVIDEDIVNRFINDEENTKFIITYLNYFKNNYIKNIDHSLSLNNLNTFNNININEYCSVCNTFLINLKCTNNVTIDNYIFFEKQIKIKVLKVPSICCGNCYKKMLKHRKEILKSTTNISKFNASNNNFEIYFNNIVTYFKSFESTIEECIANFLYTEKKWFTKEEILNNIKNNFNLETLESKIIINKIDKNNKLIFSYNWNLLNIPIFTKEHKIQLNKFKAHQNIDLENFNFNNFLNLSDLKEQILNIKEKLKNKEYDNIKNERLSIEMKNDFLIENFRKLFKLELTCLNETTQLNRVVYYIVNSFTDISLKNIIITWLSVKKIFNTNFIINTRLINNIYDFIKNLDHYPIYYKSHLNGYYNIDNNLFLESCGEEIVEKEEILQNIVERYSSLNNNSNIYKVRKPNYVISNNVIYLLKDSCINFNTVNKYYCFNDLQNDLRHVLNRYKNISSEDINNFILDIDHIPYNISGTTKELGFMVGYCDYKINNLLTMFKFEDRIITKVLNYHKLELTTLNNVQKINYNNLKSKINKEILLQWKNEIKQKVIDFKEKINEHLQKKLSPDEFKYLLIHNKFIIRDKNNINRKTKDKNDPIHNNFKELVFDHNHFKVFEIFNYIAKYFNLTDQNVSTNEEMYNVYKDIRHIYGSKTAFVLKFLLVCHLPYYGRGFILDRFNIILGYFEQLFKISKWNYKSIFEELEMWLNRDLIVDSEGNLIIYYQNKFI